MIPVAFTISGGERTDAQAAKDAKRVCPEALFMVPFGHEAEFGVQTTSTVIN